ncbi:histidine phosphatase superfamily [Rhexocercosporidium sp. MPI-PUGE-AT-0058]|nr:histidine phosphatase superfamily [Rhexocercosporidium sp. MPI-PUGE-AT-0058]
MSSSVAPLKIPSKGLLASVVTMSVSPSKCSNTCPKENCAVHSPEVDCKELEDIMGRLCLSDVTNKPRSGPAPGLGVTLPRPRLFSPFVRIPKVRWHFVRHAQAVHNVRNKDYDYTTFRDTDLTEHGRDQARALGLSFPFADNIKYEFASALRRAINTALIAFPIVNARGVKLILWDELREFGGAQCNTGSSLHRLHENIREIRTGVVNTELLYGGWEWQHETGAAERKERVERVKKDMKEFEQVAIHGGTWKGMVFMPHYGEDDIGILVVSHGAFMAKLMNYPTPGQNWSNAEYRTFKFPSDEKIAAGCPPLHFIQTKASYAKEHIPIKQTAPTYNAVIDNTTQDRLDEIQEYNTHVEACARKVRMRKAQAFGELMKNIGADEDTRE